MRTEDTELMYWHMSKAAEFDEETQDDEMWFHLVKAFQLGQILTGSSWRQESSETHCLMRLERE